MSSGEAPTSSSAFDSMTVAECRIYEQLRKRHRVGQWVCRSFTFAAITRLATSSSWLYLMYGLFSGVVAASR